MWYSLIREAVDASTAIKEPTDTDKLADRLASEATAREASCWVCNEKARMEVGSSRVSIFSKALGAVGEIREGGEGEGGGGAKEGAGGS